MAVVDPEPTKRSDLPVRVASAVVMVAVAGLAFWSGGWILGGFLLAIVMGVLIEWSQLVVAFERRLVARSLWLIAGIGYVGFAYYAAIGLALRTSLLPYVVVSVIAVDVGAYFAGRTFGGPKIAPAISPSKTWSGLAGAIFAASLFYLILGWVIYRDSLADMEGYAGRFSLAMVWTATRLYWLPALAGGAATAIVAQSGDFFESWMKRRAGVKDSGRLIPGHGGLFDRADGLIAVLFVIGLVSLITDIAR